MTATIIATIAQALQLVSFGCIAIATVVVLIRLARGPSMLDRAIAMDVVTSAMIGAVAVYSALTERLDLVPALIALSVVGFLGTTAIARFVVIDNAEEARIMSKQEVAELDRRARLLDDEADPVHDVDVPTAPAGTSSDVNPASDEVASDSAEAILQDRLEEES